MKVRQCLWNLFTDIKDHVRTSALAYYSLESIQDNLKRANRSGWLLQDDRFLYPTPEVQTSCGVILIMSNRYASNGFSTQRLFQAWLGSSFRGRMANTA